MKDQLQLTLNGQTPAQKDINGGWLEAAFAEDAVFAELLRLAPYVGTVQKAILPYRVLGNGGAMVQPNGASGSVFVNPFRAIVGARTVISGTAGTALLSWQDIRSQVYAPTDDNVTLGHKVAFTSNSSGNPRWDLVYALLQTDQPASPELRNVRAPGTPVTQAATPTSVVPRLTQLLSVGIAPGSPAASPNVPALPADSVGVSGSYYIPLAAVLILNGFGGTTTVLPGWIQMLAPVVNMTSALGGIDDRPPNRLSTQLTAAQVQAWGASGVRPAQALPSTRQGRVRRSFGFDATTASPLIGDAQVLDDSVDWRRRTFHTRCSALAGATQFAWQTGALSGAVPQAGGTGSALLAQDGQSFLDDSAHVLGVSSRNAGVVFYANGPTFPAASFGVNSAIGLYVDLSTGALMVFYTGTVGQLLHFDLEAKDLFDNA